MVFFSCQKDNTHGKTETVILEENVCDFMGKKLVSFKAARVIPLRGKKPKPPRDTTIIVDPPSLTTGVIFLDFDGHTVTNTGWNVYASVIEAAHSGMSEEQQMEVEAGIALDYDTLNVIVTRDSTLYHKADPEKRMRGIFTTSSSWYPGQAGGIAYTGSFTSGNDTPCFVFVHLLSYNLMWIRQAGSHETGHTLTLRHHAKYDANCVFISGYNSDIDPTTGYYHLMGYPFGGFASFGIGQTAAGCAVWQRDFDLMATITGYK